MKTFSFYGKTSDCFGGTIKENGKIIAEIDGYPPTFLGYDGIELEIDLETGQILNWNAPNEELATLIKENAVEEVFCSSCKKLQTIKTIRLEKNKVYTCYFCRRKADKI